jgi:KipI family sensor histidine kinase inhibitor
LYQRVKYAPFGDRALKVEFGKMISPDVNARVHALHEAITHAELSGVGECVPTYCSLLITYDPGKVAYDELVRKVSSLEETAEALVPTIKRRRAVLPVVYGGDFGPDLAQVSQYHSLKEDDVVRLHSQQEYLVYMIGFIAGFPYLGKLPEEIVTPRLETPRLRVPEGSVGIAENQTGIYPKQAPGGWRIIGRTPIKLFDSLWQPPTLLQPGDLVRFRPISAEEFWQIRASASEKKFYPFVSE